jgi:hypothetical protein
LDRFVQRRKIQSLDKAPYDPQAEAKKKPEPSASLSDPEARSMRFPDGANAQIAIAPRQGIIVSVAMTDRRSDAGLAVPMVDDLALYQRSLPQN